jgi:hypothetical protein
MLQNYLAAALRNVHKDTHGFMLTAHSSAVRDFYDKEQVDRLYTNEVKEAVKALTGANFVAVTGWMIR